MDKKYKVLFEIKVDDSGDPQRFLIDVTGESPMAAQMAVLSKAIRFIEIQERGIEDGPAYTPGHDDVIVSACPGIDAIEMKLPQPVNGQYSVKMLSKKPEEVRGCKIGSIIFIRFRNGHSALGLYEGMEGNAVMLSNLSQTSTLGYRIGGISCYYEEKEDGVLKQFSEEGKHLLDKITGS